MADVHNTQARRYNMSQIKNKNTKPELLVRRFLHASGYRYKLHDKKIPGKPDLVFTRLKTAIFINGCFWHGHAGCKYFVVPKTRTDWWMNKITTNVANDQKNLFLLKLLGWKAIVVWECDLKPQNRDMTLKRLDDQLAEIKRNLGK